MIGTVVTLKSGVILAGVVSLIGGFWYLDHRTVPDQHVFAQAEAEQASATPDPTPTPTATPRPVASPEVSSDDSGMASSTSRGKSHRRYRLFAED